jgi:hypothetical protein
MNRYPSGPNRKTATKSLPMAPPAVHLRLMRRWIVWFAGWTVVVLLFAGQFYTYDAVHGVAGPRRSTRRRCRACAWRIGMRSLAIHVRTCRDEHNYKKRYDAGEM